MTLTFPFEPILIIGPHTQFLRKNTVIICAEINSGTYNGNYYWFENSQVAMKKSEDNKTISWVNYSNDADAQCNAATITYYFAAIGGYDMGEGGGVSSEHLITKSGNFVVPKTGRYYLELYGGGGATTVNNRYQGGSSC